jgi:sialic acid synthase SpsE
VSFLESLSGITAYKIASMDLNNLSLLEALAATGKPIIMSTGMGSLDEVLTAVSYFEEFRLSILHCVSEYPLDPKNAGLNNIRHLQEKFQRARIGFSDHSLSHELALSAIGLGATVIEKHITLDREDPAAAEHHMSMEVKEFKTMVDWVRSIDASRSSNEWSRSASEKEGRKGNRRSFHYKRDMKAGTTVTLNDLVFVRPEFGIDYGELDTILDKRLLLDKESYAPCLKEDFGSQSIPDS